MITEQGLFITALGTINTVINCTQPRGWAGTSAWTLPSRMLSLSRRTEGRAGLRPLHSPTIFAFWKQKHTSTAQHSLESHQPNLTAPA